MMDSKQLALVYLMEECNRMASVCTRNVHNLNKKKTNADIEKQFGVLFSAMREVTEEFKLEENNIMVHAQDEYDRRLNER